MMVAGLGKRSAGVNDQENWHEGKESIRAAVPVGCRQVQDLELPLVEVDPCGDAQAAAEEAVLGLYEYDDLKQKNKVSVLAKLHGRGELENWEKGVLLASGQNLARQLMESQANEKTPTRFVEIIEKKNLKSASSKTEVGIRPKSWIEEQEMGWFLSVAKGYKEPPVFLEIHCIGSRSATEAPLVFVGKGTFDIGGIFTKACANMDLRRADMGRAATVCSAFVSAAKLNLPINIIGLTPLCQNTPSGKANKSGEYVRSRNGQTIQVDNTDAEAHPGRCTVMHTSSVPRSSSMLPP